MQYCLMNSNSPYCYAPDYQMCQCPPDWTGPDCSEPCPCENNGGCVGSWSERRGLQAQTLPPLKPTPEYAQNNMLTLPPQKPTPEYAQNNNDNGFYCECPFGFNGRYCEQQIETGDCGCQNGGICSSSFGHFSDDDSVSFNSNGNGGTGFDQNNSNNNYNEPDDTSLPRPKEYCICPDNKFTGQYCEIEVDPCQNACLNGGTCNSEFVTTVQDAADRNPLQFSCSCPEGKLVTKFQLE